MIRSLFLGAALALEVSLLAPNAFTQIEPAVEAHGGLARWRSFHAVEYDCTSENAKGTKRDHQIFDLGSRDGLITSEAYTLGARQGEVWVKPGLNALGGTPPRFYMWTPFYFFAMPFVFADPGTSQESLGKKSLQGVEYDAVKITYKAGTGDSPDDFYIAYIDPASRRLKLAVYVVTYPSLRKGKPVDQLEQHAIVFDEWQEIDGLVVPKAAQYYLWQNEALVGQPLGRMSFSSVRFSAQSPDAAQFAKPADAVIAPLE